MCGIAGLINFNKTKVTIDILERMKRSLHHRGPDANGIYKENNVGLVHTRLSILDLSKKANQPFICKNKRYVLIYNGELYNYKNLKNELLKKKVKFFTNSDTEVVLNSLIHYGPSVIKRFNGMFAFALYDKEEKKFLLARDRYGIKPLYYTHTDNFFSFASEQKAILQNPNFRKELNLNGIKEYFTFQNFFSSETLFKNINTFPAGNYAYLSLNNSKKLKITQYWDFDFFSRKLDLNFKDACEKFKLIFNRAVNRQLVSDVEIGSYLSGGIDSGSIASVASKKIKNMKTFTCGFDLTYASTLELNFDERKNAQKMSSLFNTQHFERILRPGDMEKIINKLSYHLEEPRIGQSYPNLYIAEMTSKYVNVVLSGTGGDELFAGYPWRYYLKGNQKNFDSYINDYYNYWQRLLSDDEIPAFLNPIKKEIKDYDTKELFKNVILKHKDKISKDEDLINLSLYFECKTFLHSLLIVEDKLSMAHSLEARFPFLDNDVVDFALKCPLKYKLKNLKNFVSIDENEFRNKQNIFFSKTNNGKKILRQSLSSHVPKSIAFGKKQGFSSPDSTWFKKQSLDFLNNTILNKSSKMYDYLDFKEVKKHVDLHVNSKKNKRLLIWSILNFNNFLNNYF